MLRKIILTIVLFATVLVNTSDTETEASLKSNQDGNSFRRVEKDDAVAKGSVSPMQFTDGQMGNNGGIEDEYYRCFFGNKGQRRKREGYCVGKYCVKTIHEQSSAVRRYCLNETESDIITACKSSPNGMPGQIERECICKGDYCNGSIKKFGSLKTTIGTTGLLGSTVLSLLLFFGVGFFI